MVATGIGVTVLPATALTTPAQDNALLEYIPFSEPVPDRRIALIWRKSFPRTAAVEALADAVLQCGLQNVHYL